MRLDAPRLAPLPEAEVPAETLGRLGDGPLLNIFATLAHHPDLLSRWLVFGAHVLGRSTLPPRERELVILRVGWRAQADYEWGQHVKIGRDAGLTDVEIARIRSGPDDADWGEGDRLLLRATDELLDDHFVGDATWKALAERFDTRQLLDLIFAVGQYSLVSMALNTLGVQLDPGVEGLEKP